MADKKRKECSFCSKLSYLMGKTPSSLLRESVSIASVNDTRTMTAMSMENVSQIP